MVRKVLVADDDLRVRKLVSITIGKEFQIVEATNGEEAVALAQEHRPEIALLDVRMPKMDGLQACRRLRSNPAHAEMRIIMLTGMGSDEDRQLGISAGADDYMVKPFSPRALLEKLKLEGPMRGAPSPPHATQG